MTRLLRVALVGVLALSLVAGAGCGGDTKKKDDYVDAVNKVQTDFATAVSNLQKAHEVHYQKALVDIISMVKHATDEQNPLLTAEERVERAFNKVTTGKTFTKEQLQWLDRIKAHLAENLSIDEEDFELPIFSRLGGWKKANGIFFGELAPLIHSFNQAIAI